jgi:hypothetical protein
MTTLSRQAALIFGATTAAMPIGVEAQPYGPNDGEERHPGVRVIRLGENTSKVPGFKAVILRDVVQQSGSKIPLETMKNAMICHCVEGELEVAQEDGVFTAKKGTVWTCKAAAPKPRSTKAMPSAIMRVIELTT